ncbi:MAG TPA: CDP-alcohol phosphatidyltransferase family protein [Candidatus Limnocylindria bacterium]|nr:CDP-alcohol phosphatidyltransferase family protein [Candidatus Limnocylindria bacterium]
MSASQSRTHDLARGDSLVPAWVKELGRSVLSPVVRAAQALHLTPNAITVIGLVIVAVAAVVLASGQLLIAAVIVAAGSLLDAVDGALARANGGGTDFGGFLDSTLDRSGEGILYIGIAGFYLFNADEPAWPVLATLAALVASFMVSYSRARAEGIGLTAAIGLAPRTERLVLIVAGIALAGLGVAPALIGAIIIVTALSVATVIQRIWHVRRLAAARHRASPAAAPASVDHSDKENR